MVHKYSKKEIERILNQDLDIPNKVQNKIHAAYEELGIDTNITMKYTKKHRAWVAASIAAALLVGTSTVALAANQILSGAWVSKDKTVEYDYKIDTKKEAHAIKVDPTYMPEGYVLGAEGTPYGGKWHNDKTGGDISIIPYNAADLDRMERTGDPAFSEYIKAQHVKDTDENGMKVDAFVSDDFYIDSGKKVNNVYLVNGEQGYAVWVWSDTDLPSDELMKVAKGLKIQVLDKVVPYATDEEIAKDKGDPNQKAKESKVYKAGVPDSAVAKIGQEVKDPGYEKYKNDPKYLEDADDIRFKVEDVQVRDSLPLDEYPVENYIDYSQVTPWLNPDGTLKPHDRYKYKLDGSGVPGREGAVENNVKSKFVVVKMKVKNYSDTQSEFNKTDGVFMAPAPRTLIPTKAGGYAYPDYQLSPANENYDIQNDFPIYFDKIYYTDGIKRIKDAVFRPLAAGEELEFTMVYVVDEDQIDNMYLQFFSEYGTLNDIMTPYVKTSDKQ